MILRLIHVSQEKPRKNVNSDPGNSAKHHVQFFKLYLPLVNIGRINEPKKKREKAGYFFNSWGVFEHTVTNEIINGLIMSGRATLHETLAFRAKCHSSRIHHDTPLEIEWDSTCEGLRAGKYITTVRVFLRERSFSRQVDHSKIAVWIVIRPLMRFFPYRMFSQKCHRR